MLNNCSNYGDADDKRREKKKKKVQFAEDVVEPIGNGEEFRKRLANKYNRNNNGSSSRDYKVAREMAANRMALYNGILRVSLTAVPIPIEYSNVLRF